MSQDDRTDRFPRGRAGGAGLKWEDLHKQKCGSRKSQVSWSELPGVSCEVRRWWRSRPGKPGPGGQAQRLSPEPVVGGRAGPKASQELQ